MGPPTAAFTSVSPKIVVAAQQNIEWGRVPQIDLAFKITPQANAVTCLALDDLGDPLPNESVTIAGGSPAVRVWFHAPNICALRVVGACTVESVTGFALLALVRMTDWKPVQLSPVVPLAFDAPSNGEGLAFHRLSVARSYTPSAPLLGVFLDPDPAQFLAALKGDAGDVNKGILGRLAKMMASTLPPAPAQSQYQFPETAPDGPWPVGPVMLMSAGLDNWLALALGLGSTEDERQARAPDGPAAAAVPPSDFLMPIRAAQVAFDYMVTADFDSPVRFGAAPKISLAAVANPPSFPVDAPDSLTATRADFPVGTPRRLRPANRDEAYLDEVQLKWKRDQSGVPYAFAVAAAYPGRAPALLNTRRANSFAPFLPVRRPQADADEAQFHSHIDRQCPVPVTQAASPATTNYSCAHVDVFGRWSAWSNAAYACVATGPHMPGVLRVTPSGDMKSADVEWNWDSSDRALNQIEFRAGFFIPVKAPKPDPNQPAFVLDTQLPIKNLLSPADTAAALAAPVNPPAPPIPNDPLPTPPEPPRYRTTIQLPPPDFSKGVQLNLMVFARAAEKVDPASWSRFAGPASAVLADPTPPPPPAIGPPLRWTSIPDARNTARALLTFPAVAGARGYAVYRCSETAIRAAAGLPAPAQRTAIARRIELNSAISRLDYQNLFLRINATLFPDPHIEVEISGDSLVLYAYYVTAINQNNVESTPSPITFVGVPRRLTPPTPVLQTIPGSPNILRVPVDTNYDFVSLYRCKSLNLAKDVALMGPPVATQTPPAFILSVDTGNIGSNIAFGLAGATTGGAPPAPAATPAAVAAPPVINIEFKDNPLPGWQPYYYRVVARSNPALAAGWLPASSTPSRAAEVYVLPPDPPDLQPESVTRPPLGQGLIVSVRSKADIRTSPLGDHRLEFFALVFTPAIAPGQAPDVATTLSSLTAAVSRSDRDANGRWGYTCKIGIATNIVVRLTDPAGRVTELRPALPPVFTRGGPSPL